MKKILLILGLLLCASLCVAQNQVTFEKRANHVYDDVKRISYFVPSPDTIELINVTSNSREDLNGWALNGTPCSSCASYFYKIVRSRKPFEAEDGQFYYYFYFYFFSNSKFNGNYVGTYLSDFNVYNSDEFILNIPYILLEPNKVIYAVWVRSINPLIPLSFRVTNISVY